MTDWRSFNDILWHFWTNPYHLPYVNLAGLQTRMLSISMSITSPLQETAAVLWQFRFTGNFTTVHDLYHFVSQHIHNPAWSRRYFFSLHQAYFMCCLRAISTSPEWDNQPDILILNSLCSLSNTSSAVFTLYFISRGPPQQDKVHSHAYTHMQTA